METESPSPSPLIKRLRLASIMDGISYIFLLGAAVYKRLGDNEIGVKILGPIHGALFLMLCYFLLKALLENKLTFKWCVIVFLCALFPLAPFFLDQKLKKFQ